LADLVLYGYAAKTLNGSSEAADGRTFAARAGATWVDRAWVADASWGVIGSEFQDELGFVPRLGIERRQALLGRHFRPTAITRWVRDLYAATGLTDIGREQGGFDSRYSDYRFLATLQNGAILELGLNGNEEDLASPFVINPRRNITVPAGRYSFTDRFIAITSSRSKPMVLEGRASGGGYYDGERQLLQVGATLRLNAHASGSLSLTRDNVELLAGAITTDLVTARANLGFSTRMFVNALVQYNSDTGRWDTNLRLNWIHHPLSDVFLVFTDARDRQRDPRNRFLGRTVAVKVTRLVSF
jgi:hypothetical protein